MTVIRNIKELIKKVIFIIQNILLCFYKNKLQISQFFRDGCEFRVM